MSAVDRTGPGHFRLASGKALFFQRVASPHFNSNLRSYLFGSGKDYFCPAVVMRRVKMAVVEMK